MAALEAWEYHASAPWTHRPEETELVADEQLATLLRSLPNLFWEHLQAADAAYAFSCPSVSPDASGSETATCYPPAELWPGVAWPHYDASDLERCQVEPEDAASSKGRTRRTRRRRLHVWTDAAPPPGLAQEARTTILVKNLPSTETTETLVELLNSEGFAGCFDFAYVPFDFSKERAFGYAFVNFCSPDDACDAMEQLHGNAAWAAPGQESLNVQWSDPHQGLQCQVARYRDSPVLHPSVPANLRPMLFEDGVRKDFPQATKAVKAPRSRRRGNADE